VPNFYERLGVEPVINAAGTLTRLGGSLLCEEAINAMVEAAGRCARIDQLQAAAGRRIADATGTEAALVTAGAAAGLTLAAAACIAGDDFGLMSRLPDTEGVANEIIIPRSHRNGYDHALRAAGAKLVEVGLAERTRDPQAWELAAAINDRTVAIAYCAGFSELDLGMVVGVARQHGLTVIVDASATLPPKQNLTTFSGAGADLVVYSGGKGLRGPQASGILCGRKDLITSAALQMLDLDYLPELWNPPEQLIPPAIVARGVPNHGIGRSMKVGKEEIAGLLAALERFVNLDEAAQNARLAGYVERLAEAVGRSEAVAVTVERRPGLWPRLSLHICEARSRYRAVEVARRLEAGRPPIHVDQGFADRGLIRIDPFCLREAEVAEVERRLVSLVG
jgi:L-seryl-tRNA(Ser) seleniumtransferase